MGSVSKFFAGVSRLARKLDRTPLATKKRRYDGSDLDALLGSASLDYPMFEYRELDAAARSWLDRHDAVPLARLLDRTSISSPLPHSFTAYSAAMEIAGRSGIAWSGDEGAGRTASVNFLNGRIMSIAGGSNQIQRNIISERILGLPREISVDSDKPFREVLRDASKFGTKG